MIAGMEWAAASGADIVNMSLGFNGVFTDGTDPASQAVDQLTEQSGTLFVIASGNNGPGDRTVTTPGASDSALTVGAVSKTEALAAFSGRGPRVGDYAIKPDVTAPGVAIVAARAAGTTMGTPVDDNYTSANGTSMATPHVSGAAAILLQQHPDWSAQRVKGVLSSTGKPGDFDVFKQGGGRIDLVRATTQEVTSATGSLSFGKFEYPQSGSASKTITYDNPTDADVTLSLVADLETQQGVPATDGMLALDTTTVTVPAGGSASVTVTVDLTVGTPAIYGGYVTATSADTVVRTPIGLYKEPELYDITIIGTTRRGAAANVVLGDHHSEP